MFGLGIGLTDIPIIRVGTGGAPVITTPVILSGNSFSTPENVLYSQTATASGGGTMSWAKGGTDAAVVTLNTATGAWSLTGDYETDTSITFTLTATNSAGSSAPQAVTVTITNDVADDPPPGTTLDPLLSTPTLILISADADGTDPVFDIGLGPDYGVNDTVRLYRRNKAGTLQDTYTNVIDAGEATDTSAGTAGKASFGLNTVPAGTWYWTVDVLKAGGATYGPLSTPAVMVGPDDQEALLSAANSTPTGSDTGTIGFTTDTGEGNVKYVVNTSATLLGVSTVKSTGTNVAITSSGAKTINVSGLSPSTGYYGHIVHTDVTGNDSTELVTPLFTTAAAAQNLSPTNKTASIMLSNSDATATSTASDQKVISVKGSNTTKWYAEVLAVAAGSGGDLIVTLANPSMYTAGPGAGYPFFVAANGYYDNGAGSNGFSGPGFPYGTRIGVAVDPVTAKAWFITESGWWSGSGDPNAGGAGLTVFDLDTFHLGIWCQGNGASGTVNVGNSTLHYGLPPGFTLLKDV